jgi:hypothetical protein
MTRGERLIYAALMFAAVVLVGVTTYATQYRTSVEESSRWTRACVFAAGAATTLNCSNVADADSGALTANTRYVLTCTDATYVRFGSAAVTAASGDMIVPSGAWLEFATTDSIKHLSVKNVNIDAACYLLECT